MGFLGCHSPNKLRNLALFIVISTSPLLKSLTIFTSLLYYHILTIYCCSVWDPSSKKRITSLEKVQKFTYKIMTKGWSSSTSTNMSWQALSTRHTYQQLTVSFKIIKNLSILDLSEFATSSFSSSSPISSFSEYPCLQKFFFY